MTVAPGLYKWRLDLSVGKGKIWPLSTESTPLNRSTKIVADEYYIGDPTAA